MAFQRRLTTKALIEEVRDLIDEDNTSAVTDANILASLNRSQDRVASILSKHYSPPMLAAREIPVVEGQTEYDIPEDTLEERILGVDWKATGSTGSYYKLTQCAYNDISRYESVAQAQYPKYYYVIGSSFHLLPTAPPGGTLRAWVLEDPPPLVIEQGRITFIPGAGNYVIVDEVGEDVTTDVDELGSYVNLIDKNTGKIKATLQVQSIAQDGKITFRTTPTRTSVQDQTVVGALPTTLQADDYICNVAGTCVPLLKKPSSNFIVQYAVAEMVKKLGGDVGMELSVLAKLEEDVTRSWSGRPNTLRVRNRSNSWQTPTLSRRFM